METNCPACYKTFLSNVSSSHNATCIHCGWQSLTPIRNHSATRKMQSVVIRNMVFASIGILSLAYHLSNWGSHSVNIVFLKAVQVLKIGSTEHYSQLYKICQNMKKYDCMEKALKNHYKVSGDAKPMKSLALLQLRREKNQEALQTYKKYFETSSQKAFDKQSAFNYAKLLNSIGEHELALEYYDKIIHHEKDIFPVNAVRNKIQLLVQLNRQQEAQKIVNKYKILAKDDGYITQEMNNLEKQILNNS